MGLGQFLAYIGYLDNAIGMEIFLIILAIVIRILLAGEFPIKHHKKRIVASVTIIGVIFLLIFIKQHGVNNSSLSLTKDSVVIKGNNELDGTDTYNENFRYEDMASVSYDKEKSMVLINMKNGEYHAVIETGDAYIFKGLRKTFVKLKYEAIRDFIEENGTY